MTLIRNRYGLHVGRDVQFYRKIELRITIFFYQKSNIIKLLDAFLYVCRPTFHLAFPAPK